MLIFIKFRLTSLLIGTYENCTMEADMGSYLHLLNLLATSIVALIRNTPIRVDHVSNGWLWMKQFVEKSLNSDCANMLNVYS